MTEADNIDDAVPAMAGPVLLGCSAAILVALVLLVAAVAACKAWG